MKKLLAIAICSLPLVLAPTVYAESAGAGAAAGSGSAGSGSSSAGTGSSAGNAGMGSGSGSDSNSSGAGMGSSPTGAGSNNNGAAGTPETMSNDTQGVSSGDNTSNMNNSVRKSSTTTDPYSDDVPETNAK